MTRFASEGPSFRRPPVASRLKLGPSDEARRQPLILASASPRRQEILRLSGVPFEVVTSDAETGANVPAAPRQRALVNARLKALDVAGRCAGRLVIGADTVVALGRMALEKPVDAVDATRMLRLLSGRQHQVHTALVIALGDPPRVLAEEIVSSAVAFRPLEAAEIAAYVASGDPLDKAGAYGLQSGGGGLVMEVLGSYLNVVGLPLARLLDCLSGTGWTGPA